MLGRAIATVGVVLGFIAIWVNYGGNALGGAKYWDDGTLGSFLLILAVLAVCALAGAVATGRRNYDLAVGAIGGVMFGMYLFIPALFAFDQWDLLDAGSWLGLCSALMFIGAQIATWASDRPAGRPAPMGMLLAVAGLALVVAGIFPDFSEGAGSYWNATGLGHSFGILLIILVVLTALSLGAAYAGTTGMDSAIFLASVTLGATIVFPVGSAFNNFGDVELGGWLAAIGGIVLGIGVWAMRQMAEAGAPVPTTAPPATPPAA